MEDRILIVDDEPMICDLLATSMRPHREAISLEEVLSEMERCNGKQFDPEILYIFLRQKIYK